MTLVPDLIAKYVRMWPREVFYRRVPVNLKTRILARELEILERPGVYILYREDVPYYIGKATRLRKRLYRHACVPKSRYYNFWNFFSAFVIEDPKQRDEIEGVLIAAMPAANSSEPKLSREAFPKQVRDMIREIRESQANPSSFSK
jgi:hypothetical protein